MDLKALTYIQTLLVFLLLFVDYAEAKVDLVCFLKVGLHVHDLRKCFFGMLEGAIPIIQNADPIP